MTTEVGNVSHTASERAGRIAEEQPQALLRAMLACLRRHRDTPLQDGIDRAGIVQAALRTVSASPCAPGSSHLADLESDLVLLDGLIAGSLRDEQSPPEPQPSAGRPDRPAGNDLAAWLEQLHAALHATHPAAVEVVALRVEGCQDREIAQRLGLGLRLVRRLIQDLRQARQQAVQKE